MFNLSIFDLQLSLTSNCAGIKQENMVLAEEERSEPVGSAESSVNQVGNLVKIHSKYSLENFLKLWCKPDFIV